MSDGNRMNWGALFTLLTPTREANACTPWRRITGRWRYEHGWPYKELEGLADISQCRGALASYWLQHHETPWSLWLDDDIVLDWETLNRFLYSVQENARRAELVCACYVPKRVESRSMAVLFKRDDLFLGERGGLEPIEACGFGLVAVKREAFERVALNMPRVRFPEIAHDCVGWPFFLGLVTPSPGDPDEAGRQRGEDFAFCTRACLAGCRLYCDTSIRVEHRGAYNYGWEDAGNALERVDSIKLGRSADFGIKPPARKP